MAAFQMVGSGFPCTTWHSASTQTSCQRTSTVGGRTPTLSILWRCLRSRRRLSRWMLAMRVSTTMRRPAAPSLRTSTICNSNNEPAESESPWNSNTEVWSLSKVGSLSTAAHFSSASSSIS